MILTDNERAVLAHKVIDPDEWLRGAEAQGATKEGRDKDANAATRSVIQLQIDALSGQDPTTMAGQLAGAVVANLQVQLDSLKDPIDGSWARAALDAKVARWQPDYDKAKAELGDKYRNRVEQEADDIAARQEQIRLADEEATRMLAAAATAKLAEEEAMFARFKERLAAA